VDPTFGESFSSGKGKYICFEIVWHEKSTKRTCNDKREKGELKRLEEELKNAPTAS
jgi:glycerol kinase